MSLRECTACKRPSNNKHFDCPPLMNDGRMFTDYRPRCEINFLYPPRGDKFLDSYKYRQHLINNADDIMKSMHSDSYNEALCAPCVADVDEDGTMLPEQNMQYCNSRSCHTQINDPSGLGTGRMYGKSAEDLAREKEFTRVKVRERERYSKRANCCATPREELAYRPLDSSMLADTGRATTPYGGNVMTGGDPSVTPTRRF